MNSEWSIDIIHSQKDKGSLQYKVSKTMMILTLNVQLRLHYITVKV